jgi:hypothetical protein
LNDGVGPAALGVATVELAAVGPPFTPLHKGLPGLIKIEISEMTSREIS